MHQLTVTVTVNENKTSTKIEVLGYSFLHSMVALHKAREAIDAEIAEAERCPLHARAAMLKGAGDG